MIISYKEEMDDLKRRYEQIFSKVIGNQNDKEQGSQEEQQNLDRAGGSSS